jgi:hypothetical protein
MDAHPDGQFTTASLYRFCTFPWVMDQKMEEMWHSKLPLKVKNFVWLVTRNRIQTMDNLGKKSWQGSNLCQLCNEEESTEHLIFRCPIAVFMWAVIKEGLEWGDRPCSKQDFSENFLSKLGGKNMNTMWFLFGAICWTL